METELDILDRRLGFIENEMEQIEELIGVTHPNDALAGFYVRFSELQMKMVSLAIACKDKYGEGRRARQ